MRKKEASGRLASADLTTWVVGVRLNGTRVTRGEGASLPPDRLRELKVNNSERNNAFRSLELFKLSIGEFDPGSGRTLAARLTHASRTGVLRGTSGGRVRNT